MKHPGKWTGLYRSGALALVCAALIGLAACSSSDGLSKAEEEALQEQVEAAEKAKEAAEKAKKEAEAAEAEAERKRKEAEAAAVEAERKRKEAEAAKTEEERKRKEAEAAAAEEERKRKAAEAAEAEEERKRKEAAAKAAEEEQKRKAAEEEAKKAQQELTEAEQAELRARASSFNTQLDAPAQAPATVTWTRGKKLTFKPTGVVMTPGSAAPSVPGGWRSASFTGLTGSSASLVNETVYLYTNIQAPGTRAFWKKYGLNEAMTDTLAPLAKGSSATAKTVTQTDNTDPQNVVKTTDVTQITVSGSFDGASGSFTCTACATTNVGGGDLATTAEINAHVATHVTFSEGRPTFATASNWTFKPGSITSGVPLNQDDAYLYFGAWSSIPDNITGTYDFRYIAGGGAESGGGLGRFDALTGPAKFSGGAVGKYVTQGQVGGQNAKIGTFTATATLEAEFGDGSTAGTLSGSITDFKEGGTSLAGWQVTLGSTDNIGVASTISDAAASGSTVASIGGLSVGGSWGATFYGSDNDGVAELTDTVKYPASKYPPVDLAGVAGWFDATGTDASLAGAFAATPSN